eukprot:141278-Prymnesium_polylepis.1
MVAGTASPFREMCSFEGLPTPMMSMLPPAPSMAPAAGIAPAAARPAARGGGALAAAAAGRGGRGRGHGTHRPPATEGEPDSLKLTNPQWLFVLATVSEQWFLKARGLINNGREAWANSAEKHVMRAVWEKLLVQFPDAPNLVWGRLASETRIVDTATGQQNVLPAGAPDPGKIQVVRLGTRTV